MKFSLFLPVLLVAAGCDAGIPAAAPDGLEINEIQGTGPASPLAGQHVTIRGIVTGDFQDNDADPQSSLGGFYLQSVRDDGDPRTSEGLFVFDRGSGGQDVQPGDLVRVSGLVEERFFETQLTATAVEKMGRAEFSATTLSLPAHGIDENSDGTLIADLEPYEGMLIELPQTLFVQDLANLERYGEILLSPVSRQYQFTSTNEPDPAAYREHRASIAAQTLMLDDGRAEQNVDPVRYASALQGRAPRLTDAVEGLRGVLRFSRGSGPNGFETWRLMPVAEPRFAVRNPRPQAPDVSGDILVASVNLLNYFSTIDDGKPRCGPARDAECRGAESVAELARQRLRTANAINQSGAAVVGLMELENNQRESIQDLLHALTKSGDDWKFIDTGTIGNDTIRVAIVYRPDRVAPVGEFSVLDSKVDARFNDARNRPALAQTFQAAGNGGRFTLAVNHLKSKGSSCAEDGDPNRGDGQGNCNATRTQAAVALADWLQSDPTDSGDDDVLIIGDLNAYMNEDPVRALENAGFANLLRQYSGEEAWSFAYRGESGVLDHALASTALAPQVTAVVEWHINADEAPLYDYNLNFGRDPTLFDAGAAWRAADHDPLLIGLTLAPDRAVAALRVPCQSCGVH